MKEIGSICWEGGGGGVFKDERGYFYIHRPPVFSRHEIDESYPEEKFEPKESAIFSSIEELEESLPYGVFYRKFGDSSLPKFIMDIFKEENRLRAEKAKRTGPS